MERERIVREEQQEMKRQEREAKAEEKREEREARMEEKRLDAQREMYTLFMQTMMTININKNNNQEIRKELIPGELTTGSTEQTSAITTSIITTNSSLPSTKRPSSELSNSNEETEMETVISTQTSEDESLSTKRNKTVTGEGKVHDDIIDDDNMTIEKEQLDNPMNRDETTNSNATSFIAGFNNQQFKSSANEAPWPGVSQH